MNDPIALLAPIFQPGQPGWWPLAPGWWILAAAIILLMILLVYLIRRMRAGEKPPALVRPLRKVLRAGDSRRHCMEQANLLLKEWMYRTQEPASAPVLNSLSRWQARLAASDSWFTTEDGLQFLHLPYTGYEPDEQQFASWSRSLELAAEKMEKARS